MQSVKAAFQGYHAADYCYLLKVFFAEVCACGVCPFKQSADNLRHAVEVSRSARAFHDSSHFAKIENASVRLGIYFLGGGYEGIVDAEALQQGAVAVYCAWVGAQVFGVVELCGVDEYADYDYIVFTACAAHQRCVSLMQGSHGRHQAYAFAFVAGGLGQLGQLCRLSDYFHCVYKTICGDVRSARPNQSAKLQ